MSNSSSYFAGFIGYASQLYELVSKEIQNTEDDQLYYTKIFLDSDMRSKLNIKLDTQAKIFQNLNGNIGELIQICIKCVQPH